MHPPAVSVFYYFWIRIFGDSEISLHLPALFFGLAGIVLLYLLGTLVFGSDVGLLATIATSCSIAHIEYSTEAVHAIFELFIFTASLLCLYKFIVSGSKKIFFVLLTLNIFGVVIFHHYIIFLSVQSIFFWLKKEKFKIPMYYFAGVAIYEVLFTAFFLVCASMRGYANYGHWITTNLSSLGEVIAMLPYEVVNRQIREFFIIFFGIALFFFFLLGCKHLACSLLKVFNRRNFFRIIMLAIFLLPFLAYFIIGIFIKKFGNQRNFFYLLPIYFFFIFYILKKSLSERKRLYFVSVFFIFVLLFSGISYMYRHHWKDIYAEKAMLVYASKLDSNSILMLSYQKSKPLLRYYFKKYNLAGKVLAWDFFYPKLSKEIRTRTHPVILINSDTGWSMAVKKPLLNKKKKTRDKLVFSYKLYCGPFRFWQSLTEKPTVIKAYFYIN